MVRVSCRAALEIAREIACEHSDEAIEETRKRLHAAAMQVALDLKRDGYTVDLDVTYLVAYEA